jgi:hypothetical protein
MATSRSRKLARKWRALNNVYFLRMVLGSPIRILFGNDAGLRENIEGRRKIKSAKNRGDDKYIYDKRAVELKNSGFARLGYPFSSQFISKIKVVYLSQISAKEKAVGKSDATEVKPALLQIPDLKLLLTEAPEISNLLRTYYGGGSFEIMRIDAWRNYSWGEKGLTKDINSNLFHNDQSRTDILKVFILLSDNVSRSNGATRIFSIDTTKKIMRTGFIQRKIILWPASRITRNEDQLNYMEGDTGFTFIFNPQLALHAAGLVSDSNYRDVICISVKSSETPLIAGWDQQIVAQDLAFMEKHNVPII